jgi:hypothetical protein
VAAAATIVLEILLKIVLMLVATPGMIAPAATATKPAIKALLNEVLSPTIIPNSQLSN